MSFSALLDAEFKTTPYVHQFKEFERSAELESRALLWQMRTGKTKLIIDTACHLFSVDKIDTIIVLAPNGVHSNWTQRELPIHMWSIAYSALCWSTAKSKHPAFKTRFEHALLNRGLSWFAFASETVIRDDVRKYLAAILAKRKKILLVVDESDDYGSPSSKRTKLVRSLARKCAYRRILTGTVVENSPLRAYSQYEILAPGALGAENYAQFKQRYSTHLWVRGPRRTYEKLLGYVNLDDLQARMAAWSSVVLREQCEDLPSLVYQSRVIEMSPQQRAAYNDLMIQTTTELSSGDVSIGAATSKIIKLQQVGSGFIIDEFGDEHVIPGENSRLKALVDEVLKTGGRNLIWCAFRRDIDKVTEALRIAGRSVLGYHGRTSESEKAQARKAFAPGADSKYQDLIGHPRSCARGLNLSGADKIIWYTHTFDAMLRSQANERATQVGSSNVRIVDFIGSPTDAYILHNLTAKRSVADSLARYGMIDALKKLKMK